MSYLILILTFLIALSGLLFKTTEDTPGRKRKKLNLAGWFVFLLSILALSINIFIKQQDEFKQKENSKNLENNRIRDSLIALNEKREITLRWEANKKSLEKSDSNLRIQKKLLEDNLAAQKKITELTETANEYLKTKLEQATSGIEDVAYPIDTLLLTLRLSISVSGDTYEYLDSLIPKTRWEYSEDLLSILDIKDVTELYYIAGTFIVSISVFKKENDMEAGLKYSFLTNLYSLKLVRFSRKKKELIFAFSPIGPFTMFNTDFNNMRQMCTCPMQVSMHRVSFYGEAKLRYWDIVLDRKEGMLPKFDFFLKSDTNSFDKIDTLLGGEFVYHLRHFGCGLK